MYSRRRSMGRAGMPGAKNGAHYSARLPFGTPAARPPGCALRARRVAAAALAWMVLGGAALPAAPAGHPEADARKAEAELQAVKSEIERITRQVSLEQVERDRLTQELRTSELSVGKLRDALSGVRSERAARAARRAALTAEQQVREAEVQRNRAALAGQLRAAYLIGRQEPLKLLLNQKDPALAGRMFAYYSYFGRARAGQIKLIEDDLQRLAQLDGELAAEDQALAQLEKQQRAQLHELEHARTQRSHVLASLEAQSHTRAQSLERLRSQQAGLEKLLRELRTAMERFPLEGNDAFARLRGKLAWPVSGRLVARFGDARAGGVHWDGVLVATERGAPVKAVCQGRVIYADWLPGLGLLTIVDHGDGYLSLYGHNERLYKAAGEPVAAGEAIAAAGDSGGSSRPELYFEIRKGGKPVDPRPWFRAADP
ncbi:MAG: peptidase M23 [Gammaproteobacteria bacterium]|nr:MAG: peptidase M23 [Gammaproteobacteria bacterium]TLZ03379.1 MAG: peptidase M23 [Gammaproteobacteria bacterium]TLZ38113.1 MAG: peptidase M23 [Gammaproteobacteria bacterium]